ncbi:MAG: serine hydrolase domain-containing protein [Moraxellaceae bacterium]
MVTGLLMALLACGGGGGGGGGSGGGGGGPVDPPPAEPDADLAIVVSAPDYWPTAEWSAGNPDLLGFQSGALAALADEAAADMPFYTSLMIVKNGHVVHESYQDEGDPPYEGEPEEDRFARLQSATRHVWSVSKSVTALAVALALSRGDLVGLEMRVGDVFDASETGLAEDDARNAITLRDALQMRSGLAWNENAWLLSLTRDPIFTSLSKPACAAVPDRVLCSVLQQPLVYTPGTTWNYSTYDSYLVAAFFERATGMTLHDYAATYLFAPLGMGEGATTWANMPLGATTHGGGLLFIRTPDLARLGQLVLHNGQWEGEPLIAPEQMQAILATQGDGVQAAFGEDEEPLATAAPAFLGYGQQWWRRTTNLTTGTPVILARGLLGQRLYVFREHNLVIALTSAEGELTAEEKAARYAAIDAFVAGKILARLAD